MELSRRSCFQGRFGMKRIVLWLVLVLFNGCGVLLISSAINHFVTAGASTSWPTVQGEVLSVDVVEEEFKDARRQRGEPITFVYYPEVKYEYTVDGATFQGDKLSVEDFGTDDRQRALQIAMQYRAGQKVAVYYNAAAHSEALLKPGDSGGALGTLIMGIVFIVVPTGMVLFIGGRDLVPFIVRFWWSMKFGKLSKEQEGVGDHSALPQHIVETSQLPAEQSTSAPAAGDFHETIVDWQPGHRVEISSEPPNLWALILVSGFLGLMVGMFGSVIIGMILFGEGGERSYYFVIFITLFVFTSGVIFGSSRFKNRRSRTILDWGTHTLDAHREFEFNWQGSLHDVQGVIVRFAPETGGYRHYATVELEVAQKKFYVAHTAVSRRNWVALGKVAMSLAEPLAEALGVSLRFEDDEDDYMLGIP